MTNTTATATATLESLSQSSLMLADPREDIRGQSVFDKDGSEVGAVDDLLIDPDETKVRMMRLGAGGFLGLGEDHFLVPIDAITNIDDNGVHIDQTREHVAGGPTYDPDLASDTAYDAGYYGDIYGYYGYAPYWGPAYAYPAYPYYGRL